MKLNLIVWLFMIAAFFTSCARQANTDSIAEAVELINERAEAGDSSFFKRYMDASARDQAEKLIEMIKRSNLPKTYVDRVEEMQEGAIRLNYHWIEKGCHYQVDLNKDNGKWTIHRIWFCR